MKILFISDNFPPETNAAASRVYERALHWKSWGHDVTVLTCQPNFPFGKVYAGYRNRWFQREEMDGIHVVRVKTFMAANRGIIKRTLDFISFGLSASFFGAFLERPDIVVATSPQFFSAVAGWFVSRAKRRPFVFELGDLWPASIYAVGIFRGGHLLKLIEAIELFLYRQSAAVVALTASFKRDLMSRGIPGEKVHVVRNGVELTKFRPMRRDDRLCDELGLHGKFVVGYIGTHGMAHGMESVMEIVEAAQARDDVRFLFVGAGAAKERMVACARERGLGNVVFVEPQPKDQVRRYWSLCDVALIPLADRPLFATVIPSKLFEAMAVGVPVLYYGPAGETSAIVRAEECGTVVPPGKIAEAVADIARFADDVAFRQAAATASLVASRSHSRLRQAWEMLEVLASVTGMSAAAELAEAENAAEEPLEALVAIDA